MSKINMLKKNYEFRYVLTKGKYFSGKNIECFIVSNRKDSNFLGIAISSKICKAVHRNRIKRLIRESFRRVESDMSSGNSIVFLWKKKVDIENATFENINKDMNKIMKKAGIVIESIEEKQ